MENRRDFIKTSIIAGAYTMLHRWAAASPSSDRHGSLLPMRKLTRNGEKVTAFCLGGWHLLGFKGDPVLAQKMIELSMEKGVRFFDTARIYQDGGAEEIMGRFLIPKYRDEIFLMSKSHAETGKIAREHLDLSLKALKTDQLDLWQIHSINNIEDVDNRLDNGVLDVFLEAKEKGKTRYIGFTGHRNPAVHLHFLNRLEKLGVELDTCQMPLNLLDPSFESFQEHVLPVLLDKEYGVLAMKTMGGGGMIRERQEMTPDDFKTEMIPDIVKETGILHSQMHQYVYTLPVSTLVSGCDNLDEIESNIRVLQNFKNLTVAQMEELVNLVKPFAGLHSEIYKQLLG